MRWLSTVCSSRLAWAVDQSLTQSESVVLRMNGLVLLGSCRRDVHGYGDMGRGGRRVGF